MTHHLDVNAFRKRLQAMQAELDATDGIRREMGKTVTLDQQSVGRLSRMDALQNQAMAQAGQRRAAAQKARIAAALQRIEDGEFGYCTECGDDIAPARLELDPTVPTCIACARQGKG